MAKNKSLLKMIVDCHTHINFADERFGISEELTSSETVDVSIVLANVEDSSKDVNKKLSDYVNKYKEKLIGFALVDPTKDSVRIKDAQYIIDKLGLRGAVLYCSRCSFHPTHSRAMQFYESAEVVGLPVFFHNNELMDSNSVLRYSQPYLLDEIAKTFPKLKMVIGIMGVPFIEQTLSMVGKHENVYADLTIKPDSIWQVYNMVMLAYECKVMDKLLFGSGYPNSNAKECIEILLGFNKLLGDTNLPTVPRGDISNVIERDTLGLLGIKEISA
ncbi:MAG: amidohydrolase family protein [Planctomycetota bacterium]|jgi:predicted TIM-barrel fold metal-dependent hydrolase